MSDTVGCSDLRRHVYSLRQSGVHQIQNFILKTFVTRPITLLLESHAFFEIKSRRRRVGG